MTKSLLLLLGVFPLAASVPHFVRTPEPAAATFHATGPGGLRINGSTPDVRVLDDGKTFSVFVPLKDVDTGIAMRNRHLKERYLEVGKFPEAHLSVSDDALGVPAPGKTIKHKTKGAITLHGVTRDLPFAYEATCDAKGVWHATGTLGLNINDFAIETPKYMGVSVKPDVTIEVKFDLSRVAP